MGINDSSFEDTHCDVCGRLNEDETSYTCPDCVKQQEEIDELESEINTCEFNLQDEKGNPYCHHCKKLKDKINKLRDSPSVQEASP